MPLQVELVSPEDDLFKGEADFVLARTVEGEIGILPGHIPVLAQLAAPSEVKIRTGEGDQTFPIDGGFMTVKDDKIIILAEEPASEEPGAGEAPV